MRVAEKLYIMGCITYPRTETTRYSSNFEFKELLHTLSELKDYNELKELEKIG